ncbi:uncharacterized protein DNG_02702 [Cephalotrichum gorgonifer]|uniref:Uncharacterized protein n=1 Tax=Cephalotrichum gorgonifer TaxID=2041049 RepID=A0AAE8STI6_9PEZI|nr:uncharacterized protein DNG_02702 [Cephalotrichum gorgonifer]
MQLTNMNTNAGAMPIPRNSRTDTSEYELVNNCDEAGNASGGATDPGSAKRGK